MTALEVYTPETPDNYHKNQSRCKEGDWPCFICGRPIKPGPRQWKYSVQTFCGADICTPAYAATDPAGDSGCYPIGSECYRNLPAEAKALVKVEV